MTTESQIESTNLHLDLLRTRLLNLKATGSDGFEGLIATALAQTTGLVFRLAKSGSQFGRDASSPHRDAFAIAMEAKRYDDNLRLEILAGKVLVGGSALSGKVDLWVLGATAEVGDEVAERISQILFDYGITPLILDWTSRPLPPLAVLLASASDSVLEWFSTHTPNENNLGVQQALSEIRSDERFVSQQEKLRKQVSSSEVGLDALRARMTEWLLIRFKATDSSQQAFGQYITVAEPSTIDRFDSTKDLTERIALSYEVPGAVVVLGEEGSGKTWLVAGCWMTFPEPLIMIFLSGASVRHLDSANPLRSLARILAEIHEQDSHNDTDTWFRRLKRWRSTETRPSLRFLVVLDGLNEHPERPWANILRALIPEVHKLGGTVVITSREAFWKRDVLPRLGNSFTLRPLVTRGYNDRELAAIFSNAGINSDDLLPGIRNFLRNPRICRVALNLLSRLSLEPNELTVERLLLEYWSWRLEERGNYIGHNKQDFEKLLRSHARAWLDRPDRLFDRDDWGDHSGALRRMSSQATGFLKDLTEIEEGRFLQVDSTNPSKYTFRRETLPFALALFALSEVKDAYEGSAVSPNEHLNSILGPVRGFDALGDILSAAVGLACLDDSCPSSIRLAFIHNWLGTQNLSDEQLAKLGAFLRACPEAFLDALEYPRSKTDRVDRQHQLLDYLLEAANHPQVQSAIEARLPLWLGYWSRKPSREGAPQSRESSIDAITASIDSLLPEEKHFFSKSCLELSESPSVPLDHAAALYLVGRKQAHLIPAIFAQALAVCVQASPGDGSETLAWAIRLNSLDFQEVEQTIRRFTAPLLADGSTQFRRAAAALLRRLGTQWAAERAQQVLGPDQHFEWRRETHFCSTNPYDPDALPGSNLDNARIESTKLSPLTIWNHMSSTLEDANLGIITPILARFDVSPILQTLRGVVHSIKNRTQLSLRQLAWRLPSLSPLFTPNSVDEVESAYLQAIADPSAMRSEDFPWVVNEILRSLHPHVDGDRQLDLVQKMPSTVPEFYSLRDALKPLSGTEFEKKLENALAQPAISELRRLLFFASAAPANLTDRSRQIIATQFNSADRLLRLGACDIAFYTQDSELNSLLLDSAQRGDPSALQDDDYFRPRAIAAAVAQLKRNDLIHLVDLQFLGYVAQILGGDAQTHFDNAFSNVFSRLMKPVPILEPEGVEIVLNSSRNGFEVIRWTEETASEDESEFFPREITDKSSLAESDQLSQSMRQRNQSMEEYEAKLREEGAASLAVHWSSGLTEFVDRNPDRVGAHLETVLKATDGKILRQIYNLAVPLAAAYARRDGPKALTVLRHLQKHRPLVRVTMGHEHIPLFERAIFETSSVPALEPLRQEAFQNAFNDSSIEMLVAAAETFNATEWLGDFVETYLQSGYPRKIALALTIASLRCENPQSQHYLTQSWGPGFLGGVAAAAVENYKKGKWSRYWIQLLAHTTDSVDFWRYSELAVGIADWRSSVDLGAVPNSNLWQRFGQDVTDRILKAAKRKTEDRRGTLFGVRAPERRVVATLLDN